MPLRAALNKCFRKTISSYGASDLEINLGVETSFTIALRQAIAADASLGEDLFGRESLPMIFQYDPLNTLIESDAERSLLFTINRLENCFPAHSLQHSRSWDRPADVIGDRRSARSSHSSRYRRSVARSAVVVSLGTSG